MLEPKQQKQGLGYGIPKVYTRCEGMVISGIAPATTAAREVFLEEKSRQYPYPREEMLA